VRPPLLVIAFCVAATSLLVASDYDEQRARALKECAAIDPSASQSGLIGNPEGYRSFYVRSECLQNAAVRFRDLKLCEQVKERRSLLSSSWGYSPRHCRELVTTGIAADRQALERMKREYLAGAMRLRDFLIKQNGNGRDFDVIPTFDGQKSDSHPQLRLLRRHALQSSDLREARGYPSALPGVYSRPLVHRACHADPSDREHHHGGRVERRVRRAGVSDPRPIAIDHQGSAIPRVTR
jgi:hypothetical protein